jgi:DNA helicase-2/ATP-dependent DNA helicase PcrA
MSIPSRFLEEVPSQLIENLGGRSPAWSTPGYSSIYGRRSSHSGDFADKHYNYEDESQEAQRLSPSQRFSPKGKSAEAPGAPKSKSAQAPPPQPQSIDNIARFFGGKAGLGKPGSLPRRASSRPVMDLPEPGGAKGLKKGQRVRHAKYGEGTVLKREGDGEDAKLTVLFTHGMKKLMEKFANLQKI